MCPEPATSKVEVSLQSYLHMLAGCWLLSHCKQAHRAQQLGWRLSSLQLRGQFYHLPWSFKVRLIQQTQRLWRPVLWFTVFTIINAGTGSEPVPLCSGRNSLQAKYPQVGSLAVCLWSPGFDSTGCLTCTVSLTPHWPQSFLWNLRSTGERVTRSCLGTTFTLSLLVSTCIALVLQFSVLQVRNSNWVKLAAFSYQSHLAIVLFFKADNVLKDCT